MINKYLKHPIISTVIGGLILAFILRQTNNLPIVWSWIKEIITKLASALKIDIVVPLWVYLVLFLTGLFLYFLGRKYLKNRPQLDENKKDKLKKQILSSSSGASLLETNQSKYIHLSEELSNLSKQIREMLADYTHELEDASWKPHLSSSNRETSLEKKDKIEAEINRKFKKYYEHDSTKLLKRASIILNRTDYEDRTKVLSGNFLLNKYCDHLNDIAEKLRIK